MHAAQGEVDLTAVESHLLRLNGTNERPMSEAAFAAHCNDAWSVWRAPRRRNWRSDFGRFLPA
jgi:hypothetical protein